jgi:hypothetical protein
MTLMIVLKDHNLNEYNLLRCIKKRVSLEYNYVCETEIDLAGPVQE